MSYYAKIQLKSSSKATHHHTKVKLFFAHLYLDYFYLLTMITYILKIIIIIICSFETI